MDIPSLLTVIWVAAALVLYFGGTTYMIIKQYRREKRYGKNT